jgi:putative sterol carrier protein
VTKVFKSLSIDKAIRSLLKVTDELNYIAIELAKENDKLDVVIDEATAAKASNTNDITRADSIARNINNLLS